MIFKTFVLCSELCLIFKDYWYWFVCVSVCACCGGVMIPVMDSHDVHRLLKRLDYQSMKFSLYFLGYEAIDDIPGDEIERTRWMFSRKATIELTQ